VCYIDRWHLSAINSKTVIGNDPFDIINLNQRHYGLLFGLYGLPYTRYLPYKLKFKRSPIGSIHNIIRRQFQTKEMREFFFKQVQGGPIRANYRLKPMDQKGIYDGNAAGGMTQTPV
jgi:hypothetical protein